MLVAKKNKFDKDRCINVTSVGYNLCLQFDTDEPVKVMEETNKGHGYKIFKIYRDLNKDVTVIDWSNGWTRFQFETKSFYTVGEI